MQAQDTLTATTLDFNEQLEILTTEMNSRVPGERAEGSSDGEGGSGYDKVKSDNHEFVGRLLTPPADARMFPLASQKLPSRRRI
jgi:hypothetical protein